MTPLETVMLKAAKIKLLVCDVDGVFTDGRVYFQGDGQETKVFHVHDGVAVKLLLNNGIDMAVISGRTCPQVEARMSQLGIKHILQGHENKLPIFETLLQLSLIHIS